jgi:hypothetical protein
MSKKPEAIKVGRPLSRTEIILDNGIVTRAFPLNKTLGRHWVAYRCINTSIIPEYEIVGEFKSWQQSKYIRIPDAEYGSQSGESRSVQKYWSWISDNMKVDKKRQVKQWREELSRL